MKILFTNYHEGYGGGHDTYISTLVLALAPEHTVALAAPETGHLYQKLATTIPCFTINYKGSWKRS